MVISKNVESVLRNELGKYLELKEESIRPPKLYLGGHVSKVKLDNGVKCWSFSSSQYMQTAVNNVETHMVKINDARWQLLSKADTPLKASYCLELDVSPELDAILSVAYQCVEMDSGVGPCGCVSGGVNDVVRHGTTKRRIPKGIATDLHILEEIPQC